MDTDPDAADAAEVVELHDLTEDGQVLEPTPLVFIEGWAAGTSPRLFDGLDVLLNADSGPGSPSRRLLVIKCGAYSSLWDRACEIYYALKGGRCDYTASHASQYTHARYGRTYAGLYPDWSPSLPLHFCGHSFGGATILYLQDMLGTELPGSREMVKSVTTISSPLRGTPLAKRLGQSEGPEGGHKKGSLAWLMAVGVQVAKNANVLGNDVYDFGGDQWTLETDARDGAAGGPDGQSGQDSTYGLMKSFLGTVPSKGMGFNSDSAGYDMLTDVMERHFQETTLSDKTYYRSYTAATPTPFYLPPLAVCHYLVATDTFAQSADWRENDGFIPVASQMHPKDCQDTTCLHLLPEIKIDDEPPPLPGVWHVRHFKDTSHFGLVDYFWKLRTSEKTSLFWREMGTWLRRVDDASAPTDGEAVKTEHVQIIET